jgi:hypothetical protein
MLTIVSDTLESHKVLDSYFWQRLQNNPLILSVDLHPIGTNNSYRFLNIASDKANLLKWLLTRAGQTFLVTYNLFPDAQPS